MKAGEAELVRHDDFWPRWLVDGGGEVIPVAPVPEPSGFDISGWAGALGAAGAPAGFARGARAP
jgi:hypothetical protein